MVAGKQPTTTRKRKPPAPKSRGCRGFQMQVGLALRAAAPAGEQLEQVGRADAAAIEVTGTRAAPAGHEGQQIGGSYLAVSTRGAFPRARQGSAGYEADVIVEVIAGTVAPQVQGSDLRSTATRLGVLPALCGQQGTIVEDLVDIQIKVDLHAELDPLIHEQSSLPCSFRVVYFYRAKCEVGAQLIDTPPVLPGNVTDRVIIEAGVTAGWSRYAGSGGAIIGMDCFGQSAPAPQLFEHFGFSIDNAVRVARQVISEN